MVECVFWGNGVVCVTEANRYFCMADFATMKVCELARPEVEELPHCVAVIEPKYTMTGSVEVLIGTDAGILMLDEDGVQKVDDTLSQKMAVSPNGNFVACFTHDGRLVVNNTNFSSPVIDESCEVVVIYNNSFQILTFLFIIRKLVSEILSISVSTPSGADSVVWDGQRTSLLE